MQNLFREGAPWPAPWFERVLPQVVRLVRHEPARTVFTRFMPPARAEDAPGTWRKLYERWPQVTGAQAEPAWLELAPELAGFAPPARVLDKRCYSPFHGSGLHALLRDQEVTTLVVSGTETDICVLGAVMDAVDLGYRVVIARDAVCSSSDSTHNALMKLYHERLTQQVEIAETGEILDYWKG